MAKKSLGYTELEWTCPFCGARNPGTAEKCTSCHAPQPADVQFEQAAEDKLITDQEKIVRAQTGPDVHCPFCNARNPAGAAQCSECLADLTDAAKREAGKTVGAHKAKAAPDVACPACGTMNPAAAMSCQSCGLSLAETRQPKPEPAVPAKSGSSKTTYIIIGVVALIVLACIAFFIAASRTEDVTGEVIDIGWTRTVNVEGLVPVEYETWREEVPAGAVLGMCRQEVQFTQADPAPGSTEVCGTPYTVDTGTGVGEVVQDCEYQVYGDYCAYTVEEWSVIDTIRSEGSDYNLFWPDLQLASNEREGERDTDYVIIFRTDGETYTYETDDEAEFNAAQPGTIWVLKVNTFGSITGIEQE
ncbi:MAG: zinc ribbon domain-containing protein [Chloroflexota bacterium]